MEINVIYILVFLLGLVIGGTVSYCIAKKTLGNAWISKALLAKNPELWELVHYVLADQEESKKITKTYTKTTKQ